MLDKAVDLPSQRDLFGWERIGTGDLAVPVIMRSNGVRYSPVKIVEQEIIKKYDVLPQSVFQCITLKSFYLTPKEAQLLNNININHSDSRYGLTYFCTKDVIISASDVKELQRYLNISSDIFTSGLKGVGPHFGIAKVITDAGGCNNTILVPFLGRVYNKRMKFVPIKFVEHFIAISQTTVKSTPSDWDIMYMKMLCIYCGNNLQHLITRDCQIVPLESLLYSSTREPLLHTELQCKE